MFKRSVASFLVVCILLSFAACGTSRNNKIVGTWEKIEGDTDIVALTIFSDGTCSVTNKKSKVETGSWEISDGILKVLGPYGGQFWDTGNLVGTFEISGNELSFVSPVIDGEQSSTDVIFKKTN